MLFVYVLLSCRPREYEECPLISGSNRICLALVYSLNLHYWIEMGYVAFWEN